MKLILISVIFCLWSSSAIFVYGQKCMDSDFRFDSMMLKDFWGGINLNDHHCKKVSPHIQTLMTSFKKSMEKLCEDDCPMRKVSKFLINLINLGQWLIFRPRPFFFYLFLNFSTPSLGKFPQTIIRCVQTIFLALGIGFSSTSFRKFASQIWHLINL